MTDSKVIRPVTTSMKHQDQRTISLGNAGMSSPLYAMAELSRGQRAMWFLWNLNPDGAEYGLPMAWTIRGALDMDAFRSALQDLVDRHPALRTTYAAPQGEPVQLIHSHGQPDFQHVDASRWSSAELHSRLTKEGDTGFDLENGPVFRARLFSCRPDEHVLFLNCHHIAADTWSLIVMMEELGLLYQARRTGQTADLPAIGMSYVDYVKWQQNMLASAVGDQHWAYWKKELHGLPVLDLPTDRPRPRVQTHVGAGHSFEFDQAFTQQIRALARQEGVTFYTVLLAGFFALLHRYSGQEDIVVGSPRFGRPTEDYGRTVGYFASPCALRAQPKGDSSFASFLQHVREVLVGAKDHQDYPFPLLVEQLGVTRDVSRSPVFQVSFTYQKSHLEHMRGVAAARMGLGGAELDLAGLPLESYPLEQHGVKFDLDFVVEEVDGRLRAVCWYNTDLWDAQSIGYLVDHYQALIASAVRTPHEELRHLPMLTERERGDYAAWNATDARFLQAPAHRLFEGWAESRPQAAALFHEAQAISYAELNARANQLAHYLRRLGLKPGQPVGVSMERSPELVVAILAVLKAGGAYLPLDPGYPADRLAYMQDDAGLTLLLTHRGANATLFSANCRQVCVDTDAAAAAIADQSVQNLDLPSNPTDLAYIIYTSGSTGRPKGVMLEHLGLSNMVQALIAGFEIGQDSRVLQFASVSFDASVEEIFSALCAGAALCLASKADIMPGSALVNTIARHAVTVVTLPPSVLALLQPEDVPTLRTVVAAGEACSLDIVKRWGHGRRFVNAYGPTEATVCATFVHLQPEAKRVSLGRPIANTRIYVLDAQLQQVPVGIAGEIHIAGIGLARGYLNRQDLTAERFIANPFEGAGARMYKTGDLARFLPDGSLEYLGRLDHQVKIRGFRIELGEVESVIAGCDGVREALVIARGSAGSAPSLVAYAIAQKAGGVAAADILAHAQGKLPDFMVPSAIVVLDVWPLTPNGKIDRAALPDPAERMVTQNMIKPRDALEQQIAEVWTTVLRLDAVGIDDNFFEVGGHSLDLVRVEIGLEKALGYRIPTMDLFRFPNIRTLADHLRSAVQGQRAAVSPADAERARPQAVRAPAAPSGVDHANTDIAIIGMAGRFPGAANVEDFWRNLAAGVESVKALTDEELVAAGVDRALLADPRYVKRKGVLDDVEKFDAAFFGYPPREALLMDPQQRLFLETGWQALEHAGYANPDYAGSIGVYGGTGRSAYLLHYLDTNPESAAELFQTTILNEKDFLSTRLAYKLNLRGPALTVQTACSTSLVAVHLACQQLILGECDMALAGGVSIEFPHATGYLYQEGHILSVDGRCRPFDRNAQGTVRGSGGAIVVLKRLSAALADGDRIWAVIKGSAINNDGNAKVGFTAPTVDGQAEVIEQALQRANVDPRSIGLVEAHGTATPLGDPIEVQALTQAWRRYTADSQFCALGSVKSNVGHLDAAAGVTGLIKAALSLHHGQIPATLHFQSANPALELDSSPFRVNDARLDWPETEAPRRAAVSSFGIGGTNAHMILEEAPRYTPVEREQAFHVLALSAKSEQALDAMTDNLANYLRQNPAADLADIAYTLQLGRTHFQRRRVVVCDSPSGAVDALTSLSAARSSTGEPAPAARVTFLFPGQGLQQVNMGRDLYESEAVFRNCIDHCAQLLQPLMALDIRTVLYPPSDAIEVARQQLMQTSITQPALFVVEYALARQLDHWGVRPSAMMGHSVGEYVAACIAGVMSLPDALKLVARRGQLIQPLPTGSMLAVEASAHELEPFMRSGVDLAVVNAARSCVLAGPAEQIDAIQADLNTAGLRSKRVSTSHAFHSAMLDPVLEQFREVVSQVKLCAPQIPYITNVTGSWVTDEQATDPAHWVRHMRQTVRFAEGLDTLLQAPDAMFLEVGPGQTFTSIIRRHPDSANARVASPTLSSTPGWSDLGALVMSLGRLWVAGAAPCWEKLHEGSMRRRVALPGYPFERQRFWPQARTNALARETCCAVAEDAIQSGEMPGRKAWAAGLDNSVESRLIKVFQQVLGLETVTVADNFFELGGSSLSALSVISQIEQIFGQKLSPAALLENPTAETLATALHTASAPRSHQLVGMRTTGARPPLFCIHPYGGHTTNYVELTRLLGNDQPVYGIQAAGLQGEATPLRRIEEMASAYIDLMKSVRPHGPYRLVGHSMGGCIAYEMAQQLTQRGESVELLALLDSRAQNASEQPLYRNGSYGKMAGRHWLSDDAVMLGILMPKLSFDWDALRDVPAEAHWQQVLAAAVTQGLLPSGTGEGQLRHVLSVTEANDEALRTYRPAPYAGPVLLCCGDEGFAEHFGEPDLGWGVLADQLDIARVPGDHHSIMSHGNVLAIARRLERQLAGSLA